MSNDITLPIYMDYQATTPMDPRVFEAMTPYYTEKFGNPHSRSHKYGWEAEDAVEQARVEVATLIGANASEVIFTSGATESNNLALLGVAKAYQAKRTHIITVATEHKCVMESCQYLEQQGYDVTYLPVQENGLLELETLKAAITDNTLLVSVMMANNEIGVIQPVEAIGKICRECGVFFHTDAAQAFGKLPIHVEDMQIDLLSISGHKIYGPKGIGALYIRRRPRVRVEPLFHGGGQERGFRSGTVPTPLAVGLGKAAYIAKEEMEIEQVRLQSLRSRFLEKLQSGISGVHLNGDSTHTLPGNLNLRFDDVEGESLLVALRELAVSSGSACASANAEPSYVLKAIGLDEKTSHTSIRFGFGRFTTEEEIDHAVQHIIQHVNALRDTTHG